MAVGFATVAILQRTTGNSHQGVGTRSYHDHWWQSFNIHRSPKIELSFGESVFPDVRGRKPYYVGIADLDAILFVQGKDFDSGQRVIVLFADGRKIVFEDPYGKFAPAPGDQRLVVVSATDKTVVLKYHSDLVSEEYHFDLPGQKFSKEKPGSP